MTELRKIVQQLTLFFLRGDVSAQAYAWLAESIIASSGAEDDNSFLEEFADRLASYSPTQGPGLFGDDELRVEAEKLLRLFRPDE